jgi:hypothetical protein
MYGNKEIYIKIDRWIVDIYIKIKILKIRIIEEKKMLSFAKWFCVRIFY